MQFLLTDSTKKVKLEKFHGTLVILFYVSPSSPQLQRIFFFIKKKQTKNNHSSASDLWEYTKSCFKENAKVFFKSSATQENIITILQQVTGGETPNIALKKMLEFFLKIPSLKKILKF